MRPRVVATILLLAAGICGLAFLISHASRQPPVAVAAPAQPAIPPVARTETSLPPPTPVPAAAVPAINTINTTAATSATPAIPETNHDDYVRDRVAELMALAMNDDSNSLNTIWSELSNSDPEIRAGALAAVVQFGDHSVSPRLRELAAQTDDAREKVSLLDAADQLDLPPLGTSHPKAPAGTAP